MSMRRQRYERQLLSFDDVYVDDGRFPPGGKPMAIREGSNSRMIGNPNDEILFLDPSKQGRGGRGGGGNTYNIIVPKGPAETQTRVLVNGLKTAGHA